MGPPGVRPSNRLTQSKYSSEPPQRNWASRLIFSTRIPRAWASFSMSATVPCSPGRTTWNSSSRKTGTRAAAMSSSIWGRPLRYAALVQRFTEVSRMRCASSRISTSRPLGSAAMNELKYWNIFFTLGARAPKVKKMFQYFNSFMAAEPNGLDVLILDEAHRIRETSVNRWTKAAYRSGRPQIDELIAAARVPVFLLDEFQVVRPGEQGTVADIEKDAHARGIRVEKISLDAQFRCGGSEEYLLWVKRLLGLTPGGPIQWIGDPHFDVEVVDSPAEMEASLATKIEDGYSGRIAAGYCWPWSDPAPDGTLVRDVQVGAWSRPWNLRGERSVGGAPAAALWATDPAGFDQVGCVYTAQGFEYDYAGVIIGPDLVWRDGGWVMVRSANKDPDFRNRTTIDDSQADRLIRNVYKVLLTRGMRGVAIHSVDPQTNAQLGALVSNPSVVAIT